MSRKVGREPARLSSELERLALLALREEYDQQNDELFGGALRRPPLRLTDAELQLGAWLGSPKEIQLSRRLMCERPWGEVVEVLKHEMAHQFVREVLDGQESAHGPLFQRVCAERGIDARAAGLAPNSGGAQGDTAGIWNKVTRLLALAQSGNRHEAEAAASAARRLMLKHNLRQQQEQRAAQYHVQRLGTATGRVPEHQRHLASLLQEFFFVETLWVGVWRALDGKAGSILEICGREENVALASYVYDFLLRAAERLWVEHKSACGITGDRERRRFLTGVMVGFYERLDADNRRHGGTGLVWTGDPELAQFLRRRYPRVRSVTFGAGPGSEAHSAGRKAGNDLVLVRPVSGSTSSRTRLLGA